MQCKHRNKTEPQPTLVKGTLAFYFSQSNLFPLLCSDKHSVEVAPSTLLLESQTAWGLPNSRVLDCINNSLKFQQTWVHLSTDHGGLQSLRKNGRPSWSAAGSHTVAPYIRSRFNCCPRSRPLTQHYTGTRWHRTSLREVLLGLRPVQAKGTWLCLVPGTPKFWEMLRINLRMAGILVGQKQISRFQRQKSKGEENKMPEHRATQGIRTTAAARGMRRNDRLCNPTALGCACYHLKVWTVKVFWTLMPHL